MSEPKWTPGPWFVGKPFKDRNNTITPILHRKPPCGSCGTSSGDWLVAWLFKNSLPKEQLGPNARLIIAAPDLYDALDKLAHEAQGFLAMANRESHGNTNIQVLAERIKTAMECCAKARGEA